LYGRLNSGNALESVAVYLGFELGHLLLNHLLNLLEVDCCLLSCILSCCLFCRSVGVAGRPAGRLLMVLFLILWHGPLLGLPGSRLATSAIGAARSLLLSLVVL